jgi:hypothetical protein
LIRACADGLVTEMPVARYFVFVGGVLLALLFISGSMLPKLPMAEGADPGIEKSFLKINSDRKWPERIVFDASIPAVVSAPAATAEKAVRLPARDMVADVSAKVRDAFAQFEPPDQKKPEPKPHPKRKTAKKQLAPPRVLVAQQPRLGFFVSNIW